MKNRQFNLFQKAFSTFLLKTCNQQLIHISFFFQSLDRRKYFADRAHSTGALNFGYISDDGILRGSVEPFVHFTSASESKQSLGQFSDHIDKYRDVAL